MCFCKKTTFEKIIYFLFTKAGLVLKIVDWYVKFRKSISNIFIEGYTVKSFFNTFAESFPNLTILFQQFVIT